MELNELYLKTAFCCMSCDGDIAEQEIEKIKSFVDTSDYFEGLEAEQLLNIYVKEINKLGIEFLNQYLDDLKQTELSEKHEIAVVYIAIKIIEADDKIETSELKFFKQIRANLQVSDEALIEAIPEVEGYLMPGIEENIIGIEFDLENKFDNVEIKL